MFGDIRNARGERLDYAFHKGNGNSRNIVVLGHGVTGHKDRPLMVALAEGLAEAGIPALRVSFSGNGRSEGRFGDSTISKEVEDLGAVLGVLKGWNIAYAGHSMGAAVGVLRAAADRRIKLLISLAGMVHTEAFAEREFGTVTPGDGYMWHEKKCPLSRAFVEDMSRVHSVLDLVSKIKVPWLLVHGTEDDVVPREESHQVFARAREPKKLIEIEHANHVFGGEFGAVAAERVAEWVGRHFSVLAGAGLVGGARRAN